MGEMQYGPCMPWATLEDVELIGGFDADDQVEPQTKLDCLAAATNILYKLSGSQFPGLCNITVRPCRKASWNNFLSGVWSSNYSYASGDLWGSWGFCYCSNYSDCSCQGIDQISLGAYPLVSIDYVKVDGVTLPTTSYRIDDFKWLVRTDGQTWPLSQDLSKANTAVNTFEVKFTYGHSIPQEVKHYAARLAYLLAKSHRGKDASKLPERIQAITRQGVNMVVIDPMQFFKDGLTGVYEIDLWLSTVNPTGRRAGAVFIGPDDVPPTRRVNT